MTSRDLFEVNDGKMQNPAFIVDRSSVFIARGAGIHRSICTPYNRVPRHRQEINLEPSAINTVPGSLMQMRYL